MEVLQTTLQPPDGSALARWCRSLTVTPGPNLERFYKAQTSAADIVLYDLEDGVHTTLKDEARQGLQTLSSERLKRPLGLRINSPRTDEGRRDLKMLEFMPVEPLVIVLPKVESAHDVQLADELLTQAGSQACLWAIVESGVGIINAYEIAQSSARLAALSFGAADFCAELGIAMKWQPLLYARSQVVLAARTAGIGVVDSPTFRLDDPEVLAYEAAAAAELGFTGKIAIALRQVEVINSAFTPSCEQVEWATSVVQTLEDHDSSIAVVGGQMVGPPFLRSAQRILTQARKAAL
ncbi:MAG TPA: CoA ester lyase [Pyrinomonadaceae bacterium]|jgi:citrate lyase beta subunit